MNNKYRGYAAALSAYTLWGIFPLYWRLIPPSTVSSTEVICHRIIWSLLTLIVLITAFRQWDSIFTLLRDSKRLLLCTLAAFLISINWLVFIWAVQNKHVVEASLGYFINPLLTVLLAVVFFRERMSPLQWVSIGMALLGVAMMTWSTGLVPWIALTLAASFACYAAVKKRTTMPAVAGLGMETAILAPLSVIALVYFRRYATTPIDNPGLIYTLLVLGGPITTLPLVLFAAAAKSVPLVAIGMLQYIGPTLQFLIAYFLFREEVSGGRMIGFVLVWTALALFAWAILQLEKKKSAKLES